MEKCIWVRQSQREVNWKMCREGPLMSVWSEIRRSAESVLPHCKILTTRGVHCPQNRGGGTLGQIGYLRHPEKTDGVWGGAPAASEILQYWGYFGLKNGYSRVKRPLWLHSQVFLFNISKNRGGARPKVAQRERTFLLTTLLLERFLRKLGICETSVPLMLSTRKCFMLSSARRCGLRSGIPGK